MGSIGPHGNPVCQGIELVSTSRLPDRISSLYHFPLFNAIQSKCFSIAYESSDNLVLSSPTGSGKTVVLELAIYRLLREHPDHSFKIVYQAPTKSLCSERQRDWHKKFNSLNLRCEELTGDTEQSQLRNVQSADIIITTPEKWDSVTRKWKDHRKLMELVKLFLIDEVHILKEDRGAVLEAVVSRMQSATTDVRFVALSATVPNSDDIATWLGRNSRTKHLPAAREVFGEDFRPVKLEKHVLGLSAAGSNDFAFEAQCLRKLPDVIAQYSQGKPIMVFCMTRKSTEDTASSLAQWCAANRAGWNVWPISDRVPSVSNKSLHECMNSGVAFHHAGMDFQDRLTIESAYINRELSVICCTSTLAVGVNLPCHFVVIKNTVTYHTELGTCKEYSDLDMMQMLGRAGRPQFDSSALAVIMTRQEKVHRYERMVSGQEVLESRLHLNLIDHLNAEVGLGTIYDLTSARKWLEGTFLSVRLAKNPEHYQLEDDEPYGNMRERLDQICSHALKRLQEVELVSDGEVLRSTAYGDAMARYCIHFETMRMIMGLQPKAKMSELLSAIAQAAEFKAIRFKSTEKAMLKAINTSPLLKFPIKVDIALSPHKISLYIQAVLGGIDFSRDEKFKAQSQQYHIDIGFIFNHVYRLVRCIIDCQISSGDSIAARNALELARSLAAKAWDDSCLQMLQIPNVGPVAVRKLANANIKSIEDLESAESQRIDMILSKNPPFGAKLLQVLKDFPKLRISLKKMGNAIFNPNGSVSLKISAELGFLNDKPPTQFAKKTVHVCLLAETSDGRVIHFFKTIASNIGNCHNVVFTAELQNSHQLINCYVACTEIAGTLKYAVINPALPTSMFKLEIEGKKDSLEVPKIKERPVAKSLLRPASNTGAKRKVRSRGSDFSDGIEDSDLMAAATRSDDFQDIDEVDECLSEFVAPPAKSRSKTIGTGPESTQSENLPEERKRLPNGKWECNHTCANKQTCRHMCCNEGMPKKPRSTKQPIISGKITQMQGFGQQSKLNSKKQSSKPIDNEINPRRLTLQPTHGNIRRSEIEEPDSDTVDDAIDTFDDSLPSSKGKQTLSRSAPQKEKDSLFLNTSSPDKVVKAVNLQGSQFKRKKLSTDPTKSQHEPPKLKIKDAGILSSDEPWEYIMTGDERFSNSTASSSTREKSLTNPVPAEDHEDVLAASTYDNHSKDGTAMEDYDEDYGHWDDGFEMEELYAEMGIETQDSQVSNTNALYAINEVESFAHGNPEENEASVNPAAESVVMTKDDFSNAVPPQWKDVDAWLYKEFGDLVDFV